MYVSSRSARLISGGIAGPIDDDVHPRASGHPELALGLCAVLGRELILEDQLAQKMGERSLDLQQAVFPDQGVWAGRVVCVDEHVNPLWRGGSNELKNRELWCKPCSGDKTAAETTQRADSYRARDKHIGALKSDSPMKCGRQSPYKRKVGGRLVWRDSGEPVG
jgi:hypothetical protein